MPDINYYELLGIKRDATPADVKKAWKKQSINLHPDHNRYGAELQKLVNEAYSVFIDESMRTWYDAELVSGANTSGGFNPDVIELEHELAESKRKCSTLKKKNAKLQKIVEADNARKKLAEARNELAEKTREADCAREEADNTRHELTKSKRKHAILKKKFASAQMEVGSVRKEADSALIELAKTNLLLSEKERLNKQLQLKQTQNQNKLKLHKEKSKRLEEESRVQLLYCQDKLGKADRVESGTNEERGLCKSQTEGNQRG